MAASSSIPKHLSQQALSDKDKSIIEELGNWTRTAKFSTQRDGDFEVCEDSQMKNKGTLLKTMDMVQKYQNDFQYSIYRVPTTKVARFKYGRPFFMLPITSPGGDVGNGFLSVGSSMFVHRDQTVLFEPKVDILVLILPQDD